MVSLAKVSISELVKDVGNYLEAKKRTKPSWLCGKTVDMAERINRLKFKFRYHDGRLVDFRCVPFNFSIEFNCLRNTPDKKMKIVVPPLYNL